MSKINKFLVKFFAFAMLVVSMFSFTACEDIKTLEVKIQVYNYEQSQYEEQTLSVDLYRHLAPKTVDAILDYVEEGYYNETVFYQVKSLSFDSTNAVKKILVGDLKYDTAGNIIQQIKPQVEGEFSYNSTKGSNLVAEKGSIGLWRNANAGDGASFKVTSSAMNSGRATWFLPTETIADYNGYFCIFAQIDTEDEANTKALSALENIFANTDKYEEFQVYYTGSYDETKANDNYGLTFNCVKKSDYNEDNITGLFKPEGAQSADLGSHIVRLPILKDGKSTAKILSVSVK